MELVDLLTKGLGINASQATCGAGLLLKQAQEKLSAGDFSSIVAAVPGIDGLISATPAVGPMGGLGNLAAGLGGGLGNLGGLANLASGFSKLGLSTGMIGKFIPIILSFVESKGGAGIKALLEKALT